MAQSTDVPINAEQVYKMVEKVRCETHLSHKLACHAVYVVLENLSSLRSSISATANDILKTLETPPEAPESLIDNTQDMARLFIIAEDLDSVRNDVQQRSWELFDDQAVIMEYLNELNCILMDADFAISKRFLHVTEYHIVNCLAEYYQMESRWPIKMILLKTFNLLCALSRTATVILLASVLPLELTRDIQNDPEDKMKLAAAIGVLTKMFSTGEPLPIIHFETIGKEFLLLLLNLIESLNNDSDQEDIIVNLVNFIVLYNLQFSEEKSIAENITIEALSEANNPKVFSETLLLLFNRASPFPFMVHGCEIQNSLVKIMVDIFSHDGTSNLFYNNDVRVLIDIVLRQLIDNSPKTNERYHLLKLFGFILMKTDSSVYKDRITDIKTCVTRLPVVDEVDGAANSLIDEISMHLNKFVRTGQFLFYEYGLSGFNIYYQNIQCLRYPLLQGTTGLLPCVPLLRIRICKFYYSNKFFYCCPSYIIIGCLVRMFMSINDICQILGHQKISPVEGSWYYDEKLYSKNTTASCCSLFIIFLLNMTLLLGVLQDKNSFLLPWILVEGTEIFIHVTVFYERKKLFPKLCTCGKYEL